MAGEAHAAEAAGEKLDIVGHLMDHDYLQVPLANASHFFDGKLPLPQFPPFQIYGVSVDLSITRHVVMMWIAGLVLVLSLLFAFRRPRLVPSGLASFFEAIVIFVRDDIVLANMGERGRPYLPYLLTIFFFILTCNLLGLFPYTATATGNISVTAALAFCSFVAIQIAGIANNGVFGYLRNLIPRGIPGWLLPLMVPVELLGVLVKPFTLCIRLFANMTSGHVVVLALISIIFIFKNLLVAPVSVAFAAAVYLLEIFIALVQAFIFTLLSALFIGMAAHSEH
jgi:F-type H+-transporting ATPase subunit a